jgi:putative endonuclease
VSRERGNEAEGQAVKALEQDGYTIIERNYNCRRGEIDIIATKDSYICFVEVKYRNTSGYGTAIDTITKAKIKKILLTAKRYLYEKAMTDIDYRIDAVLIDGKDVEILSDIYVDGMSDV